MFYFNHLITMITHGQPRYSYVPGSQKWLNERMSINFYKNKLVGSKTSVMSKSLPRGLTALNGRKDGCLVLFRKHIKERSLESSQPGPMQQQNQSLSFCSHGPIPLPPIFTEREPLDFLAQWEEQDGLCVGGPYGSSKAGPYAGVMSDAFGRCL